MSELAAKLRRDRKQARMKAMNKEAEQDGNVQVVSSSGGQAVDLPVAAVAAVFEEKKPKRALKKDWATAE